MDFDFIDKLNDNTVIEKYIEEAEKSDLMACECYCNETFLGDVQYGYNCAPNDTFFSGTCLYACRSACGNTAYCDCVVFSGRYMAPKCHK